MINECVFDDVHDCQESFRLLLQAISNPGQIVSIDEYASKLNEENNVFITIALTLLDKETSFMSVDNGVFSKTVAELTYSKRVEDNAGFIFVTEKCTHEIISDLFSKASPGTFVEPHTNSVLIVAIDKFEDSDTCYLLGPGIKGMKNVGLSEYTRKWIEERDSMGYEYPTGVDMYFVTEKGELMGIPRKVKMEG